MAAPRHNNTGGLPDLPPCEGPKLHAFRSFYPKIRWLERIDQDRSEDSVTEGYVFKVEIDSQTYALKVFKFFSPESTRYFWEAFLGSDCSLEKAAYYTDPFYAECRAYGRIIEAKRKHERDLAVPCYGYLYLKSRDEEILRKKGVELDDDVLEDFPKAERRVRAIVKKLAPQRDSGLKAGSMKRVLMNIRYLNRYGIYNRDVRAENFKGGLLVDFGQAWTEPHEILDSMTEEMAEHWKIVDMARFDEMVAEEEIKTQVKATRDFKYCAHLRRKAL